MHGRSLRFQKNADNPAERAPVQYRDQRGKKGIFKSTPKPLYIRTAGNLFLFAEQSQIDIGLDGIGHNEIRLFLFQQPFVFSK